MSAPVAGPVMSLGLFCMNSGHNQSYPPYYISATPEVTFMQKILPLSKFKSPHSFPPRFLILGSLFCYR